MRKTLLFCLCASLAIFACQKDRLSQSVQQQTSREQMLQSLKTEQERNFFASEYLSRSNPLLSAPAVQRGPTDSLVGWAYKRLLEQNQTNNFIPNLVNYFGYPGWEWAAVRRDPSNNTSAVLIPLAKTDGSQISGYIAAFLSPNQESDFFLMVDKWTLDSLTTNHLNDAAGNIGFYTIQYLYLNHSMFGELYQPYLTWAKWRLTEPDSLSSGKPSLSRDLCDDFPINANMDCSDPECPNAQGSQDNFWDEVGDTLDNAWNAIVGAFNWLGNQFQFADGCATGEGFTPFILVLDLDDPNYHPSGGGVVGGGGNNYVPIIPAKEVWFNDEIIVKCQNYEDWLNGEWEPGKPSPISEAEITRCNVVNSMYTLFPGVPPEVWQCIFFQYESGDANHIVSKINALAHHAPPIVIQAIQQWMIASCSGKTSLDIEQFIHVYKIVYGDLLPILGLTTQQADWLIGLPHPTAQAIIDFLNAHQNSPFSIEIANIVIDNQMFDITLDELNYLHENLPLIEEVTIPPTNPPVSLSNPICPQIFNFKP
jgi:hypothetical protein